MKNKALFFILLSILLFTVFESFGKEKFKAAVPEWKTEVKFSIEWQELTSLGILIVKTKNELIGINPDNGKIKWEIDELKNIKKEELKLIPNTPFIIVDNNEKDRSAFFVKQSLTIFNILDGTIICNTRKEGIDHVYGSNIFYKNGTLIVVCNKDKNNFDFTLNLYDIKTGELKWSNDDLFSTNTGNNKLDNLNKGLIATIGLSGYSPVTGEPFQIDEDHFLISTMIGVNKINIHSGKVVWRKLFRDFDIIQTIKDVRYHLHPKKKNICYIEMDYQDDEGTTFRTYLNAVDINSEKILWDKTLKFSDNIFKIETLDTGLLLFSQLGLQLINLLDYDTGQGLWGKKGGGLKPSGHLVNKFDTDEGYILTMLDTGSSNITINKMDLSEFKNYSVNILNIKNGTFRFKKDINIKGLLKKADYIKCGLFYATNREVNIIDLDSGKFVLKKSIESKEIMGGRLLELPVAASDKKYYVYSPSESEIYEIDKNTGNYNIINKKKIEYEENDYPIKMEIINDNILLISGQHVLMYDRNGKNIYHKYYPGDKGISIVKKVFEIVELSKNLVDPFQIKDFLQELDKIITTRRKLSKSKDYIFMTISCGNKFFIELLRVEVLKEEHSSKKADPNKILSSLGISDTYGIARIDKKTGEIIDVIYLGKDDNPKYEVDGVEERVFFLPNDKIIECYQF